MNLFLLSSYNRDCCFTSKKGNNSPVFSSSLFDPAAMAGREKIITGPEESFIDVENSFKIYEDNWDSISEETTTFANIVEHCKLNNSTVEIIT